MGTADQDDDTPDARPTAAPPDDGRSVSDAGGDSDPDAADSED